jgi:hypothetical protein
MNEHSEGAQQTQLHSSIPSLIPAHVDKICFASGKGTSRIFEERSSLVYRLSNYCPIVHLEYLSSIRCCT